MKDTVTSDKLPAPAGQNILVWDRVVRVFHWTLAGCFFANYFLTEDGELIHELVGYLAVAAIGARLYWGLHGSQYARFSAFWPNARELRDYLLALRQKRAPRYLSHNPAGAVMMATLVAMMLALGGTGFLMARVGLPFGEDFIEEVHELIANLMMFLVLGHVGAAVLESLRHRENLIRSMITGYKRAGD